MKTIKLLQLFLLSSILFSCSADDLINPTANSFTINSTDFETPHAYLLLDDGPPYKDGFFIVLSNAHLIQNNTNGAAVATTMTQAAVLFVKNSTNSLASEQLVQINTTTHTLNTSDTEILTNVSSFDNTFINSGITYGQPSHTNATLYEIQSGGNGTVTINSITIDYITRIGTLDCTYQMTASSGEIITGNYSGTFEILTGY